MTIREWMFNPFIRFRGFQALLFGMCALVVSGVIAGMADIRFDGLLDLHFYSDVPLWVPVAEGLVNWTVLTALLWLIDRTFSQSAVRLVDVAGVQALARAPLLPAAVICSLPGVRGTLGVFAEAAQSGQLPNVFDMGIFAIAIVVMLGCTIWMVALMWKAFSFSCSMKGTRAVVLFIAAVVIGEFVTVYLTRQYL